MKEENELENKLINLQKKYHLKASATYIEYLNNKIKKYENQIKELNDIKIYSFQTRKKKQHQEKIEIYNEKIMKLYQKLEEEFEYIIELNTTKGTEK